MTSRAEILAETLARLEAERYMPRPSWSLAPRASCGSPVSDWTPEEQAEHRRLLEAALDGDGTVVDFLERRAAG